MSLPEEKILADALYNIFSIMDGTEYSNRRTADEMAAAFHGYTVAFYNGHTHNVTAIGSPTGAPNP